MSGESKIQYKNLLRSNADFRNLWLGQTISSFGDSLYNVAIMWIVYVATGSALQIGLVMVAKFLPEMILGMVFGVWADRFNRKRLMQISDAVQALSTAVLAVLLFFDVFHISYVYVLTVILALASVMFMISQNAMVPDMVQKEHLVAANSLMSSSRQIARLAGSVSGGVLVATLGSATSIAIDAATFVVSILFVQLIRYIPIPAKAKADQGASSMWGDIREGFSWLRGQRILMLLIILGTVSNVALGPTNVLPPMLIKDDFNADASALGVFDAAIALGLLLGGLAIGALSPKRIGLWFAWGLGLQGVSMVVVSFATHLWVAHAANFVLGVAVMVTIIPMSTLFQLLIPSEMRGRVGSMSSMMFNISIPITYGAIGALADVIGAQTCYTIGGSMLIASMLIGLFNGTLREAGLPTAEAGLKQEANANA